MATPARPQTGQIPDSSSSSATTSSLAQSSSSTPQIRQEPQPAASTCSAQPVAPPSGCSLTSSSSSIPAPGTTRYPLKKVRDDTPTDDELEELGNEIVEWRKLGRRLNVSEPKLEEISQTHDQLSEKVYYMLIHWKQGNGSSATYKTLCNALKHKLVKRQDLAERFCYIYEPCPIQQPVGAVPSGRVTGEVSDATASTFDSGDSSGARDAREWK